ncbi:hypothetical protein FRC09_012000 [Ceratobasidium sp. 395]|nr:hypothetical protein FRC09_012000 [Ceratobasidium sp. 395]
MEKSCALNDREAKEHELDNPMHIETPLVFAPLMSARLGYDIYLKLEARSLSSFKYRGISLFAVRAIKEHGSDVHLVAASSGNAGLALAWVGNALGRIRVTLRSLAVSLLMLPGVRVSIYIPTTASSAQGALRTAGAEVVIGGHDYGDALLSAQRFCEDASQAVLVPSYDHPTLWEGHSTMVHEMARQLPNGVVPDVILCSAGIKIVTTETHGANAYHLSLLSNSEDLSAHALVPNNIKLSTTATKDSTSSRAKLTIATLPAITSEAISLGARSPSQTAVELGLDRRFRAAQDPSNYSGLTAVTIPDEIAIRAALEFLDEQKMLVELACAATLAHAYIPGLLSKLVPNDTPHRPVVVFIVCGGSKMSSEDVARYHNMVKESGTHGLEIACQQSLQPSQSFKYRGMSLYAARAVKEHGPGVHLVTASGGNAGLALAWAGKALGARTSIYIPAAAYEVKPGLLAAGAEVIIGGKDYAAALDSAREYCTNTDHAVLFHAYDHPTLWEGHSTLVHETAKQLPSGTTPDAIICSVGGAGLLGGVLRGVNDVGWDQTRVITFETFGSNCFHLSLLANSEDKEARSLIPDSAEILKRPRVSSDEQTDVSVAHLSTITSQAWSLGAPSPAQAILEQALDLRARASRDPTRFGGLTAVTISDELVMRSTLGFLDEQKMLVELGCAVTLSPAYIPGLLEKLVPKPKEGNKMACFAIL